MTILHKLLPAALLAFLAAAPAHAADWTVDPARSTIGFSGTQTGSPFTGRFTRFDARIRFDPAHPEAAHALVTIDMASATTGDAQRDGAMPGKDWFAVTQFPKAVFEATGFAARGPGAWETRGTLTLRGIGHDEALPFTLTIDGATAHAKGRLQLVRSAFGVGQGPWSTGQWVALEVGVDVDLVATRVN
jgi:polyisoprenoid-binding protein YceI